MLKKNAEVLREMSGRAANKYQVDGLFSVFGEVSSSLSTRLLLDFTLSKRENFKFRNNVSTGRVMERLEEVVSPIKNRAFPKNKGVWWNSAVGFVNSMSGMHSFPDEKVAGAIRAAYKNEGLDVRGNAVADLFSIIGKLDFIHTNCRVLFGREATTPYYKEADGLRDFVLEKIRGGWGSYSCGATARAIGTLEELEAPVDLSLSFHEVFEREKSSGFNLSALRPKHVLRYHLAGASEREYMRTVLETGELWEGYGVPKLLQDLKNPLMYEALTRQVKDGIPNNRLLGFAGRLKEIEQHPEIVPLLGLALNGKKVPLDEFLRSLGSRDFDFLGGDNPLGNGSFSGSSFSCLIDVAKKGANDRVMRYLGKCVESGAPTDNIGMITQRFWDGIESFDTGRKNVGMRSYFSKACFGDKFEKNVEDYLPRDEVSLKDERLKRSVGALKNLYDGLSGIGHQVVVGKTLQDNSSCYVAGFMSRDMGMAHFVFPNSMMFDPAVTEENCGSCATLSLCKGMEEYASAVVFDPSVFRKEYLERLGRTVPGSFDLRESDNGLHRFGSFVLFPEKMSDVYFNPMVTERFLPMCTGDNPLMNMVVFQNNMAGSSYLFNNLRAGTVGGSEADWVSDESVVVPRDDFDSNNFQGVRGKMKHLIGREIVAKNGSSSVHYHPSISGFDLRWKLSNNGICGRCDEDVVVGPVYERKIS